MVQHGGSARWFSAAVLWFAAIGCTPPAEPPAATATKPGDSQHAGITTPHGDHSPHHGGIVLMSGELHYEVVLDPAGRHAIWFSDAVREDLPASVASKVAMTVMRPNAPDEVLTLAIDDSGESWIASGKPLGAEATRTKPAGAVNDAMVKVSFVARGEPLEIEIPYPSIKSP